MKKAVDICQGDSNSAAETPTAGDLGRRVAGELVRRLVEPLAPGLHLVSTPIGNLGDVTLRALSVLARVDLICCEDTRHSRALLAHYAIDRPLRAYHEHNAESERPRLLAMLGEGRSIALISDAGTPLVSDPGFKLVRDCIEAGHPVTCLPGASAVMAALVASGLPTDQFHFAGFLPSRDGQRRARVADLGNVPATIIVFEAPSRLPAALADIAEVLGGERQVAVARELTKRFEEIRRGTAAEMAAWSAAEPPRGEMVILIGPPDHRDVTDEEIEVLLAPMIEEGGLKEAARAVAARLGVSRSRVYAIGLALKNRTS